MLHDNSQFDQAILAELDDALDFLQTVLAREVAQKTAEQSDALRKLRLFSAIDLAGRCRRLWFMRREITANEKYRSIASQTRQILSAWGEVPPQFAKFYVPEDVYGKLYPLYLQARDRAAESELRES